MHHLTFPYLHLHTSIWGESFLEHVNSFSEVMRDGSLEAVQEFDVQMYNRYVLGLRSNNF